VQTPARLDLLGKKKAMPCVNKAGPGMHADAGGAVGQNRLTVSQNKLLTQIIADGSGIS
jgi:hypothetical protein